jgi:hypothetical protein
MSAMVSSVPTRGAYRGRHERGAECGGREAPTDERHAFTDAEVVWSWRPEVWRSSPSEAESFARATVANGMVHRGARISRNPSRREGRSDPRLYLWFTRSRNFSLRGGPGRPPGLPCALGFSRVMVMQSSGANCAARTCMCGNGLCVAHPSRRRFRGCSG